MGNNHESRKSPYVGQVTVEDAIEAEAVLEMLMGDDVEPRRAFIEDNAVYVENLISSRLRQAERRNQ